MFGKKGELSASSKPVIDITTGVTYVSATDAAEKLGLGEKAVTKICAVARGDRHSAYERVFRYLDTENKPIFVNIPTVKKSVKYVIDVLNNVIYQDLKDAAKAVGAKVDSIRDVCNGRAKSCYGVYFKYGEEHEVEYIKPNKIYDKVLPEYKYLVNTVPSSTDVEKV